MLQPTLPPMLIDQSLIANFENERYWGRNGDVLPVSMRARELERAVPGRFPFTINFGKFLFGISVWEERVPFVTCPIRSQAPLCRFS